MSRRKARELAFKALFQVDLVKGDVNKALDDLLEEHYLSNKDSEFARSLALGTLEHLREIDQWISRFSPEWPLERMSTVDRNLLRMATYEMLYVDDVHPVIAIDEAVDMAKKYGDENSKNFVNAILDKIREENE